MLRIDHQRARSREAEPGADRGVSYTPAKRSGSKAKTESRFIAWVEQVLRQQQYAQQGRKARGLAAPLPGEDDRAEPGAGDAADCPLSGQRHGASGELSAAPLCAALHAGRHRTAGRRRRGARHASADRPPGAFCSANTSTTAKPSTSGWRPSRWPTCTICAASSAIANAV